MQSRAALIEGMTSTQPHANSSSQGCMLAAALRLCYVVLAATGSKGPVEFKPVADQHGSDAAGMTGVDAYLMVSPCTHSVAP